MDRQHSNIGRANLRLSEIQIALMRAQKNGQLDGQSEVGICMAELRTRLIRGNTEETWYTLLDLSDDGFIARLFQKERQRLMVKSGWEVLSDDALVEHYDGEQGGVKVDFMLENGCLKVSQVSPLDLSSPQLT